MSNGQLEDAQQLLCTLERDMTKSGCSVFHLLYPNAVPHEPRGLLRLLGRGRRAPQRELPPGTPLALALTGSTPSPAR